MATTFGNFIPQPSVHEDSMELSSPSRSPYSKEIDIDHIDFDEDTSRDHNMEGEVGMFEIDNIEMTEADNEPVEATSNTQNMQDEDLIDYSDEEETTASMEQDNTTQHNTIVEEDLIDYSDEEDNTTHAQVTPAQDHGELASGPATSTAKSSLARNVTAPSTIATSVSAQSAPETSTIKGTEAKEEEEDLIDYGDEEEGTIDSVPIEAAAETDISNNHADEDFIDYSDEEDSNAEAPAGAENVAVTEQSTETEQLQPQPEITTRDDEQTANVEQAPNVDAEQNEDLEDDLFEEEPEEDYIEEQHELYQEETTVNEEQDLNHVEETTTTHVQELEETEDTKNAEDAGEDIVTSANDVEQQEDRTGTQYQVEEEGTQDQSKASETQDSQRVLSQDESAIDQSGYITAIEENGEEEPHEEDTTGTEQDPQSEPQISQARHPSARENRLEIISQASATEAQQVAAEEVEDDDNEFSVTFEGLPAFGELEIPPTPTDTGLHPIILDFERVKYPLFRSRTATDGLLSDDNLINSSLSTIMSEIRDALNDRIARPIQSAYEMFLHFHSLSLGVPEESSMVHQHSMMDILDIYLRLYGNDGLVETDIPAMSISLSISIRLGDRITMLRQSADQGVGSVAIQGLEEYRESGVQDPDVEDDIQHIADEEEEVELDLSPSQVDGASTPAKRALDDDESPEAKRLRTS